MPVRGSLPDGVVMAFNQVTAATVETPWAAVAQLQRGQPWWKRGKEHDALVGVLD
jgi:hypothetical protein